MNVIICFATLEIAILLTISVSFKKYKLAQAKRNAENGASAGLPSGNRPPHIRGNSKISGQPHEKKMIKSAGSQRGLRSCSIAIGFGGNFTQVIYPPNSVTSDLRLHVHQNCTRFFSFSSNSIIN